MAKKQIPKCPVCDLTKWRVAGEYVCPFADRHDSRPPDHEARTIEQTMTIVGLAHKYAGYGQKDTTLLEPELSHQRLMAERLRAFGRKSARRKDGR